MSDSLSLRLQNVGRANWITPPRVDAPELLDMGVGEPADVAQSLADLWRINRFLGGVHSITTHLYPRLLAASGQVTCIDIGAGSGELAASVALGARRRGVDLRMIVVDLSARNLSLAQQHTPTIDLLQADAHALPFALNTVDYVLSSLVLHHFTPEQVIALLRSAYESARRGVIMSDLVRGYLPILFFRLTTPIFATSYITRYDGSVSLRRAYTPSEMRELADAAGMKRFRVHVHHPWFRMVLVADR
jgi:2-polyprenyl-3-methyl-5-hydroxy-6-metoxy-1,4-benzoquinol methylase